MIRKILSFVIILLMVYSFLTPSAAAYSSSWNVNSSGNWSTDANWNPASNPGGTAGDSATVETAGSGAASTLNLDISRKLGTLNIGNTSTAWNISTTNGSKLTFDNNGSAAQINSVAAYDGSDNVISTAFLLNSSLNITNASSNPLDIQGTITGNAGGTQTITNNSTGSGGVRLYNVIADGGGGSVAVIMNSGTSNLMLYGANTYTGTTSIQNGAVGLTSLNSVNGGVSSSSLGAPTTVANGTIALGSTTNTGTLYYIGGDETTDRVINLAGTTGGGVIDQEGWGLLKFTSDTTATGAGSKTLILEGSISGPGEMAGAIVNNSSANITSVIKSGTGTWTLSDANTYTGTTTINAGALRAGAATQAFGVGSAVTVTAPGTLDLGGFSETIGSLTGTGTVTDTGAAGTLTVGDATPTTTFSGVIQNGTGATSLTKQGTGALTLTGADTYTGTTTVSAGTLALSNASNNNIASSTRINIVGSADLDTTGLSGHNLMLANGQTLAGSGTVTGNLTVGNGSILSPGNSPGTISNVGDVTYSGGGSYTWQINKAFGTQGSDPGWDLQSITGGLTVASTALSPFTIDITSLKPDNTSGDVSDFDKHSNHSWNIVTTTTGITGFLASEFTLSTTHFTNDIHGAVSNGYFAIGVSGDDLQLLYYKTVDGVLIAYWRGAQDGVWSTNNAGNTNWATTSGGGTDTGVLPSSITDVFFTVTNGAANFTTTLSQDFSIKSLAFTGTGTDAASHSVTIGGSNTLTVGTGGITIQSGSASHAISSGVALGASESWTNNSTGLFTVSGNIDNGANTLTVDGVGNAAISGVLGNGAGGLIKDGAGTLTLTGNNSYIGGTTISAGTIQAGSSTALGTGAVVNSATLDVGTTNLTLGAGSAYTQNAGSTLKLTANSSSTFGKITSVVAAAVDPGSTISVTVGGYIPNGTTFSVLNTGGAVTVPGTITSSNQYLTFIGAASGNNLVLTASRSGSNSFSGAGTTANSNASTVGAVLDNVTRPSTDMTTILTALGNSTVSQVASSENSMTPTTDGATTQTATAMLNQFINNTETHLENTRATGGATGVATGDDYLNGVDIWAQGLGDYAHQDPRGSSNGYNATSWGVSGGADKSFCEDLIRVGLGSGYGQTFVNSKDFSNSTGINSIPVTIYGDYENSDHPFYVDAAFTFIYNTYSGSRQVTAGPTIARTANADYNGEQYSGYIEGGYSFFYKNISLTPLASFQYMHLHTGSYTETNAGALNLTVASQDYDMAQTGLGAKVACPFEQKYGTITPDLHFKWLYDWVGDNQATTAGFAGGGTAFGTNGFNPAQSEYNFGAKLNFKTKYNITIDLDYDFLFKSDYYEHCGTVDVKYSF